MQTGITIEVGVREERWPATSLYRKISKELQITLSLQWNRMERVSMHLTLLGGVCLFALRWNRDMEKEGDKGQTKRTLPQRRDAGFKWGQPWTLTNTPSIESSKKHRQEGKGQPRKQSEFALWVHIDETSPSERHNYSLKNCSLLLGRVTSTKAEEPLEHESRREPLLPVDWLYCFCLGSNSPMTSITIILLFTLQIILKSFPFNRLTLLLLGVRSILVKHILKIK